MLQGGSIIARTTKPRGHLTRECVLVAAIALADREGAEALTMRRLGQKLRVEAMSLYNHVANKEDLLDGMVDGVFGEIALPASGAEWKAAMRRRAISARAALARHPWAIGLMESRTRPGPANLRHHDAVLGCLRAAGFSGLAATRAYNLVNSYVYGFALQEVTLPFRSPEELSDVGRAMLEQVAGGYPHLRAVAGELMRSGFAYAEEFEVGLDLILDAFEKVRTAGRGVRSVLPSSTSPI